MAQKSRPWFSSLFSIDRLSGFKEQAAKKKARQSVQLNLEVLEDRTVPTVVINPNFGPETPVNGSPTVMTNSPTVDLIFWGANWASNPADVTFKNQIITAYQNILSSNFLQVTKEYGTTGSAVYGSSYVDSASSPPVGYDDSGSTSGALGQAALQAEIANVINTPGSGIAGPAGNNILTAPIYLVFAQPDVSAGAGNSATNGGYNVPGTYSGKAINMVAIGTSGSVLDFVSGTGSHELAERMTDPKEDGSGTVFNPPSLPTPAPSPFPSGPGNYQVGDGEAEGQTYNHRLSANGTAVQFIYSAQTKSLAGVAGTWVYADGNSQTLYLTPNWTDGTNSDSTFTGNWNLTINGDQLAIKNDSITLAGFASTSGGTGLAVNLNGQMYQFDPGTIKQITVKGLTGSNTLTLDFSSGNFIPTNGISFDGGTGASGTLVLKGGSFTNEVDTATGAHSGTITLDGASITYSNLSPVIDTATVINLTIKDPLAGDTVNIKNDPNSPENGFVTSEINGGGFEKMDFANKANVVFTDTSGVGGDAFNVVNALVGGASLTINGSGAGNTLTGPNQADAWNITGANAGNITGVVNSFTDIQNLVGGTGADTFTFGVGGTMGSIAGGGGSDAIDGANQTDTWNITGANAGSITGVLTSFTAIQNLVGGMGADAFVFGVGGTMGSIDGGGGANSIDGANQADAWTITGPNAGGITGVLTSFVNIQSLVGGTGADAFTFGVGGTMGSVDGNGGNDTIVGADQPDAWNITSGNAGNIAGVLASFVNVQNLVGGAGADAFVFSVGASIGMIDGGGGPNAIAGADQPDTWNVTGPNRGNIVGVALSYMNIQTLLGGAGDDAFVFSAGATEGAINGGYGNNTLVGGSNQTNDFQITGGNHGSILGALAIFDNIENLAGGAAPGNAGTDVFEFFAGGGLAGKIAGGTGREWLDYDPLMMPVWANLTYGQAYGVGGGVTHLATSPLNVIGSGVGGDLLVGDAAGGVLEGHNGNNTLIANGGRTILIGGFGRNLLEGSLADDLIINGATYFDLNVTALSDILAEWQGAAPFATRVSDIRTGVGLTGGYHLALGQTVFCPATIPGPHIGYGGGNGQSTMIGNGGQNWFFTLYATDVVDLKPTDQVD